MVWYPYCRSRNDCPANDVDRVRVSGGFLFLPLQDPNEARSSARGLHPISEEGLL